MSVKKSFGPFEHVSLSNNTVLASFPTNGPIWRCKIGNNGTSFPSSPGQTISLTNEQTIFISERHVSFTIWPQLSETQSLFRCYSRFDARSFGDGISSTNFAINLKPNQRVDPTVKTPVESGKVQGTAGHP